MDLKKLRNVYVPVQLFNRKTSAMLDTGCDSSIIWARLLPPGVHVEPTLNTLRAANGNSIPVEGVAKVTFCIGTQEFTNHDPCCGHEGCSGDDPRDRLSH